MVLSIDTQKDILRKQFEIIMEMPLSKRLNGLFEMTELSRQILQNRILLRNPEISEIELKVDLFRTFYRFDFDKESIDQIADSMRQNWKKNRK